MGRGILLVYKLVEGNLENDFTNKVSVKKYEIFAISPQLYIIDISICKIIHKRPYNFL